MDTIHLTLNFSIIPIDQMNPIVLSLIKFADYRPKSNIPHGWRMFSAGNEFLSKTH